LKREEENEKGLTDRHKVMTIAHMAIWL